MVQKEYNTVEYYAQTLRDFLVGNKDNSMRDKYGGTLRAKHSGSAVIFLLHGFEAHLRFVKREGGDYAQLEIKSQNGIYYSDETRFNPGRSKTGRIPPRAYQTFFKDFIIFNIKKLHRKES